MSKLNGPQREAVTCTEGPLLVLAGAGSGKTRVLTHRVAYLIADKQVSPWSILALTFTNKAAGEMRERVEKLVGSEMSGSIWVLTFHSFCVRILRREIQRLGYDPKFVIYDDADQQTLIRHVIRDMQLNDKVYTPRQLSSQFSAAKNHSLDPAAFLREAGTPQPVRDAFQVYEKYLRKNNALDFDDLLLKTLELFRTCPEALETYRDRFRYILVDEYQDTNMAQYHIVQALASVHGNLCVVGDDDQSIYGWRGADIRNILEFEKDFPGARVIRLEQNYRSTERILEAANRVISNNRGRKEKTLWTDRKGGETVDLTETSDDREEAFSICSRILTGVRHEGHSYNDYAILYRTHAQSRALETSLKSFGIPYHVYGGVSFFQRSEIKDILSYLRLLENPSDDIAFRRVINTPKRGLGDAAVAMLESCAAENNCSLLSAAMRLQDGDSRYAGKLKQFCGIMAKAYDMTVSGLLSEAAEWLIGEIRYREYIQEDKKENSETRLEILDELINYITEFEESLPEDESNPLQAFLENAALFAAVDQLDESTGQVTLMTLHSAKGLEFPVVFLSGMEEGLFPSSQSRYDPERMEEERRLCYVGITRAMDELHLTRAKARMTYGSIEPTVRSVFLDELSDILPMEKGPDPYFTPTRPKLREDRPVSFFGDRTGGSFAGSSGIHSLKDSAPVKKPAAEPHKEPAYAFRTGQRVRHAVFGSGTVLSVSGTGGGQILEIDFDAGQTKRFSASLAPVKPLEEEP